MKITVNMAPLSSEQVKCLSQLGTFCADQIWESSCESDDLPDVIGFLKNAGICDLFLRLDAPRRAD